MKTVALIQARYNSSRLPGKVLLPLAGRPHWPGPLLPLALFRAWIVSPLRHRQNPVTPRSPTGVRKTQSIVTAARRMTSCAVRSKGRTAEVIRLTADCRSRSASAARFSIIKKHGLDFASNAHPSTGPDGLDCEVIDAERAERGCGG